MTTKGYDEIALQIKKLAKEEGIPIIENRLLARALAERVRVGARDSGRPVRGSRRALGHGLPP